MKRWVVICCCALLAVVCADECPDGGKCDDGQTCCKHPSNNYECCPFDQAECCGDHVHCCPAGTTCDMSKSSCVNSTVSIPWTERSPVQQPRVSKSFRMIKSYIGENDDNICPDQSRCPAEFSCLRALTKYGCCPLAQGIPCSDGKHCCPEGQSCSKDSRSCIKKVDVVKLGERVSNVSCDSTNACPVGTTCCLDDEESWACCQFPNAVCCSDQHHCCPSGTTCDLGHGTCDSGSEFTTFSPNTPAVLWLNTASPDTITEGQVIELTQTEESEEDDEQDYDDEDDDDEEEDDQDKVHCNHHKHCPRNSTCCRFGHRRWGCCPMPHAVCCSDGKHCCPQHFNCSKDHQGCVRDDEVIPWYTKLPVVSSIELDSEIDYVRCRDGKQCPPYNTCCLLSSGKYGCCPMENGVCCSGSNYCCPQGQSCTPGGGCTPNSWLPWDNWPFFRREQKKLQIL